MTDKIKIRDLTIPLWRILDETDDIDYRSDWWEEKNNVLALIDSQAKEIATLRDLMTRAMGVLMNAKDAYAYEGINDDCREIEEAWRATKDAKEVGDAIND